MTDDGQPKTRRQLAPADAERSRAIVLVHGAWVGEWSWLPVSRLLAETDRAVHLVSLTGHGARRHQSGPHVTLDDHIADVVSVVETFDLDAVTLVGHSYGGRVITGAAEALASRVAAVVYLDAHTPVAEDPGQTQARIEAAERNGGMLPFPDEYSPRPDLVGGEAGVAWFTERLMPQSFACLEASWVRPLPPEVRKTFVFASGYTPTRFGHYADICREDPEWRYYNLDGPHFLMSSHPSEVAEIIVRA